MEEEMYVVKRDGSKEIISFDKILRRIKRLGKDERLGPELKIHYTNLAVKVIDQLYDGISTTKIDELSAEQCASLASTHPDYNALAGRIVVSNLQKNTTASYANVVDELYRFKDIHGTTYPLVSDELYAVVQQYAAEIDAMLDFGRDYLIDYFGFKTLERSYLFKVRGRIVERPQHMWMRVAVGIHAPFRGGPDADLGGPAAGLGERIEHENSLLDRIKETYDLMSLKYFTHATPTLFNAGTPRPQLSSCFLEAMESDSIDGIYNTLKDCAQISKMAGGIGLHIHNIRATGSHIRGTNGTSNGIVPMLRVFNNTAKYVDQCVPAGTVIYTTQGPLRIENCIAGETMALNATGQAEVIQNVLEHSYSGKILKICTLTRMDPTKEPDVNTFLRITSEHPVLINRDDEFDWVDARELMKDDKIVTVVPQYTVDLPEFKTIDCIMYGILYQYTYVSIYTIEIREKNPLYHELMQIIRDYFEYYAIEYVTNTVGYITNNNNSQATEIKWKASTVCPLRQAYVYYDRCSRKAIHHKILNLPIEKLESCLKYIQIGEESYKYARLKLRVYNPDGFMDQKPVVYGKIVSIHEEETLGETILYDLQMKHEHNYLLEAGIVHNGGGKRNGSFAIYLEPWHADIEAFLEMRKNHGDEELKARDLFYALWIPDLFMERVGSDGTWTLMCPHECPGLADVYGDDFVKLYEGYEANGMGRKVKARELWYKMLDAQMETGTPYMCYKDAANKKSNQKNIGIIKSSNLCVAPETLIFTDKGHLPIQSLADQTVNVWNGEEWSEVVVRKTGQDQTLIRVELYDGAALECTPYHKFLITDYTESADGYVKVDAQTLITGTELYTGADSQPRYVKSVIETGRISDTYCFTEPKRGMGVFNGILTGQCTEIMEVSTPEETAVCNLASIALPSFVQNHVFDYAKLHEVTKVATRNLNRVIDINYYPIEKAQKSNLRHRPIGLGVQGLADTFILLDMPFCSDAAREVNRRIFETIYHGALEASCELAKVEGAYETFAGSPASEGVLQFDLWFKSDDASPDDASQTASLYDWAKLKSDIQTHGLRNSLLVAPMPTASTSQILGFNECIEPITSNIYSRRTNAGEFVVVNKYMMRELIDMGMWNESVKNNIIANHGSVQHLDLPENIREKYKTVWELPMRGLIDMAADRGQYICQSQSLNLWIEDPNYKILTSMHFYAWRKGLKTGIYYLRRRAKHHAQKFTIEPEKAVHHQEEEICEMCSA